MESYTGFATGALAAAADFDFSEGKIERPENCTASGETVWAQFSSPPWKLHFSMAF